MPDDAKRAAQRALVDRILTGPGCTAADLRSRAFAGAGLQPSVNPLLDKVVTDPTQITDDDFAATGLADDQLFELVVCAAVGRSTRMYESALAALDEADT
jgi:hypothetical protein